MDSRIILSEELAQVLEFLRNSKLIYNANKEQLSIFDRRTSDFNHALELDNLNYSERAKLATKQRLNLIERRKCKDITYLFQPLADLLSTKEGTRFINLLNEVLGKIRKVEKSQENRKYHKRINND